MRTFPKRSAGAAAYSRGNGTAHDGSKRSADLSNVTAPY
jgi:hypothetical protein